jgi:glycosyltransferase involved in cell wall biosynthesis
LSLLFYYLITSSDSFSNILVRVHWATKPLYMSKTPLISVVMPVYNQEPFVAETIESVLAQDFKDFEFLIVDDGSKDGSADIIRRYAALDPRIKATYAANSGKARATNALVAQASGEWCAFLDADDLMLPQRLTEQLAFHQATTGLDGSSCHCQYINQKGDRLGTQRHPGLRTIEESRQALATNTYIQVAFTGLMVRKSAYEATGGLRQEFWPGEDFDFFNRFIEKGFSLVIMQKVLMLYRMHAAAISTQNPIWMHQKTGYVHECIRLRRAGLPEITFEEFMATRGKNPWWTKANRLRYNYAQFFFRNAGIALMSKNYLSFGWQLGVSTLLSPLHALLKAQNLLKGNN